MILQILNPANYSLNGYAVPMLVVGVSIALLGLFVLVREHGSLIGMLFLLMGLSTSLYLSATGVNYASHNDGLSLLWIRISQLGSVFIPTTVLLFTVARLGLFHRFRFTIAASIVLSTLLAFGVIFTDLHVRGSARFFWGNFVQYGCWGSCLSAFSSLSWSSPFASTGRNTDSARTSCTKNGSEAAYSLQHCLCGSG